MLKLVCTLLFVLPTFAWAAKDLECSRDDRPRNGDMVSLKVKTDSTGTASAYLTTASGGRFGPGAPVPVAVVDKLVASGMSCIASKLDERILSCANESWSETVSSTFTSRSVLVALGRGNVTHNMVEEFVVTVNSAAGNQTFTFGSSDCFLK